MSTLDPAEGMAKAYDPRAVEARWYAHWEAAGYFTPVVDAERPPFVIMPPPNVTGELHNGHTLFVTLEDIMIRWHRMLGDPSLWVPGRDHAGIAAQLVVERDARAGGPDAATTSAARKFLDQMWEWMESYGGIIQRPASASSAPRPTGRARCSPWTPHHVPRGAHGVRAPVREGADLSRPSHRQLVQGLPDRAVRPRGRIQGGPGHAHLRALPGDRRARRVRSPSPRRDPRRSWATSAWPCTRTTSATRT